MTQTQHFAKPEACLSQHKIEILNTRTEILDLASGSGRNTLELAAWGCSIHCIDKSEVALSALKRGAAERNLDSRISMTRLDLEGTKSPLDSQRYGGAIVFRYLHRPLFANLKAAVKSGGWVIYQTFREQQVEFGRPKNPDFLLKNGELAEYFSDWQMIESWEGIETDPQTGQKAALARIFARKL